VVLVHNRQMPETLAYHQIQSVGGTGVGLCTERVLGHNLRDSDILCLESSADDPESQILCGEDTSDPVVVVGDKNAVFALCCHQLTSLCHGHIRLDLQSLVGPESQNGSRRDLATLTGTRTASALLAEVLLEFGTEGLKGRC
jgi:hypothetical protein